MKQMKHRGTLFVLTGPSGTGKGTVIKALLERTERISLSISATTRAPRDGEENGVHYYFLTQQEFEQKIQEGAFLEYAKYADNYYGTLAQPVTETLDSGCDVILEIEVQGALQIKKKLPHAILIFIAPPNFQELENRLRGRGTETEDKIQKRLQTAKTELLYQDHFDYVIVNDVVEQAVQKFSAIIAKHRNA